MRRKLLLLNIVLAGLAVYGGWQLRVTWRAAKARRTAIQSRRVPVAPPPPFTPLPSASPVVAGGYADIVQKMLFDRSRDPSVPVEVPPPAPAPPPKPMPPLPVYHGMMNLGGITVVLSADASSPHQGLQIGDSIGQFKLVDVNTEEITFEWDGQMVRKKLEELEDHTGAAQQQQQAAVAAAASAPSPSSPPPQTPLGPGTDIGGGFRACQPNDSHPAGVVVDGFRKVVFTSPFGQTCRWDPVR